MNARSIWLLLEGPGIAPWAGAEIAPSSAPASLRWGETGQHAAARGVPASKVPSLRSPISTPGSSDERTSAEPRRPEDDGRLNRSGTIGGRGKR